MTSLPLSVGLEIEFCSVRFPRGLSSADTSFRGVPLDTIWPECPENISGWRIKHDQTCGVTEGELGLEVTSPIITSEEQLEDLRTACDWLSSRKAVVNHRCGVHVHLGVNSIPPKDRVRILDFLGKYEPAFFALVPPYRRKSPYCGKINDQIRGGLGTKKEIHAWATPDDRKCWVNGLSYQTKGTLEFRLLEGTLDGDDIFEWVDFLLHIVTNCTNAPRRASSARSTRCQSIPLALHNMMVRCDTYGGRATDPERAKRASRFMHRRYREIHGVKFRDALMPELAEAATQKRQWKALQRKLRGAGKYFGPVDGMPNPELLLLLAKKAVKRQASPGKVPAC